MNACALAARANDRLCVRPGKPMIFGVRSTQAITACIRERAPSLPYQELEPRLPDGHDARCPTPTTSSVLRRPLETSEGRRRHPTFAHPMFHRETFDALVCNVFWAHLKLCRARAGIQRFVVQRFRSVA